MLCFVNTLLGAARLVHTSIQQNEENAEFNNSCHRKFFLNINSTKWLLHYLKPFHQDVNEDVNINSGGITFEVGHFVSHVCCVIEHVFGNKWVHKSTIILYHCYDELVGKQKQIEMLLKDIGCKNAMDLFF